jgi:hypothetical protein
MTRCTRPSRYVAQMAQSILRWALPSLFLLVALWVAVIGLHGTAPVACDELPRAFSHGVKTEDSTVRGGALERLMGL